MASRSGSRRSWAAGSGSFAGLPPLAAAAHASLVLRASSLDPLAAPFGSPSEDDLGGRLHFSDSEASDEDSVAPPSSGRGAAAALPRRMRRRRRRPARRPFLAGPATPPGSPSPRNGQVPAHPARMSALPDSDGFRVVESRRRWRRAAPPRRPIPANLVGKCFNCLSESHVKVDCTEPPRCFHCRGTGHQERSCPLLGKGVGKRGRSPSHAPRRREVPPRRRYRRGSPADTIFARSASTGRSPSVPRICGPPTPDHTVAASAHTVVAAAPAHPIEPADVGAHRRHPAHADAARAPAAGRRSGRHTSAGAQRPRNSGSGEGSPSQDGGRSNDPPREPLRRVVEPPASPRSRARSPLRQLVVVPRTPAL